MPRYDYVDNFLTEVRNTFTCADHPNYGSDDNPPDGLLNVWISGLDMFNFTPQQIVEVLKSVLPAGSKFLGDFYLANRDGILLRFAHPDLPKLSDPLAPIEYRSLGQLQKGQ